MTIKLIDRGMRSPEGTQLIAAKDALRRWHVTMIAMLGGVLLIGLGTLHPDVSGYSEVGKIRIVILLFFLAFLAVYLFVLRRLATWPGFLLAIDSGALVYPVRHSNMKWDGRYAMIDTGSLLSVDTKYPGRGGIRIFVSEENTDIAHITPLVGELGIPPTGEHVVAIGFPAASRREAMRLADRLRAVIGNQSRQGESSSA